MQTCFLCGKQKILSKKSHIIPKFMYDGMFVDNEPIYEYPVDLNENNKHLKKRLRIGYYEKDLLCLDCEQKELGHYYDDYVATIHNGLSLSYDTSIKFEKLTSELGFDYFSISNIDNDRFRLFFLSVLFRISISISNLEVFNEININERLFSKIHKAVYTKVLDRELNIYLTISCYEHHNLEYGKIISKPATLNLENEVTVFSLLINGYVYLFYVTDNINKLSERVKFLSTGKVKIEMLDKDVADKIIASHFGKKARQPTIHWRNGGVKY